MTNEKAIAFLQDNGWLVEHDRIMTSGSAENKGEWIEVVIERFPNGEKQMWHYECSACSMGEPPCPINKEHWDFCPNCGADMRGDKAR